MTTMLLSKLATGVMAFAIALAVGAGPASAQTGAASPRPSYSTQVSGVLVGADGRPLAAREIHFQGRLSGDIYILPTRADGAFSISLPAGTYALRDEYGAIIVDRVKVGTQAVSLGQVSPPGRYSLWRVFDRQVVAKTIVRTTAPSSAYLPSSAAAPVAAKPIGSPSVRGAAKVGQAMFPLAHRSPEPGGATQIPSGGSEPTSAASPTPD